MKTAQGWDLEKVLVIRRDEPAIETPAVFISGENAPYFRADEKRKRKNALEEFLISLGFDHRALEFHSTRYPDFHHRFPELRLSFDIDFISSDKYKMQKNGVVMFAKLNCVVPPSCPELVDYTYSPFSEFDSVALNMALRRIFDKKNLESVSWGGLTNPKERRAALGNQIGPNVFELPEWRTVVASRDTMALHFIYPNKASVEKCASLFSQFAQKKVHHGKLKRAISLICQANMLCPGMAQIEGAMDGIDNHWVTKVENGFSEIERVIMEMYKKAEGKLDVMIADLPHEVLTLPKLVSGELEA